MAMVALQLTQAIRNRNNNEPLTCHLDINHIQDCEEDETPPAKKQWTDNMSHIEHYVNTMLR